MIASTVNAPLLPLRLVPKDEPPTALAADLDALPDGRALPIFGHIKLAETIIALAARRTVSYLFATTWAFSPDVVFQLAEAITAGHIRAGEVWIGTNSSSQTSEGLEAAFAILSSTLKICQTPNHAKIFILDFADGASPLCFSGCCNLHTIKKLGPTLTVALRGHHAREALREAFSRFVPLAKAEDRHDDLSLDL